MQGKAEELSIKYAVAFAALIYACTLNRVFCFLAFALGVYVILKYEFEVVLPLFMFIIPMSTIFKPSASSSSYFTYLELLLVLIYFIRNGFNIKKVELGILFFGSYIILIQGFNGGFSPTTTIKMIFYLFLISITLEQVSESNYKLYLIMYIFGLIVSSIMGLVEIPGFHVHDFITVKVDTVVGDSYNRFAGLYGDPNYYSINIIIAISLLIILYLKKEISLFWSVLLSAVLVFFAAMTVSKSALLMLCFPVFLLIYALIKRKNFLGTVIVLLAMSGFVWMIMRNRISIFLPVLNRLLNKNTDITSGRIDLWKLFFNYFKENPTKIWFGRSIAHYTLENHVAHNTYIDIVYELGIIGGVFLFVLLAGCVRTSKRLFHRRTLINYSIIAIIAIMYSFLSELQYFDPPFHIIIAGIVLNLDMGVINKTGEESIDCAGENNYE